MTIRPKRTNIRKAQPTIRKRASDLSPETPVGVSGAPQGSSISPVSLTDPVLAYATLSYRVDRYKALVQKLTQHLSKEKIDSVQQELLDFGQGFAREPEIVSERVRSGERPRSPTPEELKSIQKELSDYQKLVSSISGHVANGEISMAKAMLEVFGMFR